MAARTAELLAAVCHPVVEIGPGRTPLPAVLEPHPGSGPLAAIAAGWAGLEAAGWTGPVLVVATDLPNLTLGLLRWLGDHPHPGSVVPVRSGRVQPLCARYSPADLEVARALVGAGRRSMGDLIGAVAPHLADEAEWSGPGGGLAVIDDVDTPADLTRLTGI